MSLDSFASENGVHLHAVEVGIGPHVDHDVQDADFNETRLPSQKYYDQYTGLEVDSAEAAAARHAEIDFACRLKASSGWSSKGHVRLAPSASRMSQLSHQARHRSTLFVCFALS